ncbi:DHBP synthase RibB-like alpha/beta domain-containing protein [Pyronema domesticum]|uniref:3,4-dihydroxy-2-butanone 4-phosphate synthase n=1 Tax=Pyronema omphalodes (strain CBS 100304) TaxID=1076935 RepID=U4L2P8_PYROM|nr:DHBP synthase RibB-like alpha/beta domain-containing protein [Pyronema domesticum]CCX10597.1 Similar to 3,4-dihydroxy-2-butanone 4-phosphate synthase; acc. no. Q8TG90 [Pyronema omphalodes CBS 100304]
MTGFDSIEDCIAAFANGEFLVVLDADDRENEGDLIIAAQDLTTEKMAFMVRYTSGLICTPLSYELTEKFKLPQMVQNNQEPHATAFTISVDAKDPSVSTGISAYDRALTARWLADPNTTAENFRSPGHVFPLRAVKGGVLERRGHTEAAVAFARLSGKTEATAICELVREDDGLMMRRDDCLEFGKKHNLKVCTIEQLVAHLKM